MAGRLRVAIDARVLQQSPLGGVGRMLSQQLPRAAQHVDFVLLTERKRPVPELDLPTVALGAPWAAPALLWLQSSVWRWLRSFDGIFHGSFYAVPFRCPVPTVVTLHDLSFEIGEIEMSPLKRVAWQRFARHAARSSPVVLTTSEFVVAELEALYGVDRSRVVLTPPASDPVFSPTAAAHGATLAANRGLPPRFVATLGGTARRQPEVAIGAFLAARNALGLSQDELGLAVVGPEWSSPAGGVVHFGAATDEEWAAILAAAELFLYATRYEGYGMPAVEAIASSTPVVAAKVGALPEVLGDAAIWADRSDVDALAEALRLGLSSVELRRTVRDLGRSRLAILPSWDDSASSLVSAYELTARNLVRR